MDAGQTGVEDVDVAEVLVDVEVEEPLAIDAEDDVAFEEDDDEELEVTNVLLFKYIVKRFPAPQSSESFPAQVSSQSVALVKVLPAEIEFPHQHSCAYSNPAYKYCLPEQYDTHASMVMEVVEV